MSDHASPPQAEATTVLGFEIPWRISEKQIGETLYRYEVISASNQLVFVREIDTLPEYQALERVVAAVNAYPSDKELISGQAVDIAEREVELRKLRPLLDEMGKALDNAKCIGAHRQSNADFYCWMQLEKQDWCPRCLALSRYHDLRGQQ